jgi:hypothetical protein
MTCHSPDATPDGYGPTIDCPRSGTRSHPYATLASTQPVHTAFKNSATSVGGLFGRMFHLFSLNCETFLTSYHKQSNVESTFAMIKAKFGDSVRSKTDVAMKNESRTKMVCHNIVWVTHELYEAGLELLFRGRRSRREAHFSGRKATTPVLTNRSAMLNAKVPLAMMATNTATAAAQSGIGRLKKFGRSELLMSRPLASAHRPE